MTERVVIGAPRCVVHDVLCWSFKWKIDHRYVDASILSPECVLRLLGVCICLFSNAHPSPVNVFQSTNTARAPLQLSSFGTAMCGPFVVLGVDVQR